MVESNPPTLREIESDNTRTFTLTASSDQVNIGSPETGRYPAFIVYLNRNDERLIGCNLLLRLEDFSPQCKNARVSITQLHNASDGLKLEDVHQEGDILCIGEEVKIVLRRFRPFRGDGPIFFMAARKDLKVISPQRLVRIFSSSATKAS